MVTGLYVIDYGHDMYHDTCTDAFSYMRGTLKACHAHAELHPFNVDSLTLVSLPVPSDSVLVQKHLMAAPFYEDYYSWTYEWNKVNGVAGDRVDQSIWTTWKKDAWIFQPAYPPGCANCQVGESLAFTGSGGASNVTWNEDESINLHMSVTGNNISTPTLWITTINVWMSDCSGTACLCKAAPVCRDRPSLPAFCGAPANCAGACNIAPSEPGTKACDFFSTDTLGADQMCKCE